MLIIPAIDIQGGYVVRFVQGRRNKKIYSRDPRKTALRWVRQGARFLHLVDLDGAASGSPRNLPIVRDIVKNIDVPVEFGGGVRNIETIRKILDAGIRRVVLGTRAAEDRNFLEKAFRLFKDRIIVSIDASAEKVMLEGWQVSSRRQDIFAFARRLKEVGFQELIYTDTLKDGTLEGPNLEGIRALLKASQMKIIASGGISSSEDIHRLKSLEKNGLSGIIIGKALYEGRLTLPEALKLA